jgi:hypothetical protein
VRFEFLHLIASQTVLLRYTQPGGSVNARHANGTACPAHKKIAGEAAIIIQHVKHLMGWAGETGIPLAKQTICMADSGSIYLRHKKRPVSRAIIGW